MTVYQDPGPEEEELTDLVQVVESALRRTGALGKLKAQTRAAVILSLDEKTEEKEVEGGGGQSQIRATHQNLMQLQGNPQAGNVLEIVGEFLQWCGLDYTLEVFKAETGLHDDDFSTATPAGGGGKPRLLKNMVDHTSYTNASQRRQEAQPPSPPPTSIQTKRKDAESPTASSSPITISSSPPPPGTKTAEQSTMSSPRSTSNIRKHSPSSYHPMAEGSESPNTGRESLKGIEPASSPVSSLSYKSVLLSPQHVPTPPPSTTTTTTSPASKSPHVSEVMHATSPSEGSRTSGQQQSPPPPPPRTLAPIALAPLGGAAGSKSLLPPLRQLPSLGGEKIGGINPPTATSPPPLEAATAEDSIDAEEISDEAIEYGEDSFSSDPNGSLSRTNFSDLLVSGLSMSDRSGNLDSDAEDADFVESIY